MHSIFKKLFEAQADDGNSVTENVANYRHLMLAIDTDDSAELTVKIKGSIQDTPPDFSAAQSADNQWEYLQLKDLNAGTSLAGGTGLVASGTDLHKMYEVNTNGIKYIAAEVSGHLVGSVSVGLRAFNEA